MLPCEACGGKMEHVGSGSQRVEGERDPVHVQVSRCASCGRSVRRPDLRPPLPTKPDPALVRTGRRSCGPSR